MRFISILLIIYFISISVLPCADRDDTHTNDQIEYSETHHSDNCPDGMECSPFCACACCGCVGFNLPFYHTMNFISYSYSELNSSYSTISFIPGFLASIWQPPKIS